ncbi:hypothetical protein EJ02DRAFT_468218 [Clathrospora elynae]|uniref:Uncharacterized protein n=1 Tax=Clathrospora elynae TaxID=706981 RepID=A0A6A5SHL8_9PLEO|nr:hypothetical protein EJ02DRAFT_468218 [Clathrospora elynae]
MMTAIQNLLRQEIVGFQAQLNDLRNQESKEVINISSARESSLDDHDDDDNDDKGGENRSSDIDYNSPAPPLKRARHAQLPPRAPSTRYGRGTHTGRPNRGN